MAKEIHFDDEAKELLQKGVNISSNAIGSTMGPRGKTVVISNFKSIPPFYTKDGVTVSTCIQLKNELENIGAQMIKEACKKTAKDAGDGTTQTAVLAQSLITNGLLAVKNGANPQEVKIGMDKAIVEVVNSLNKQSNRIENDNEAIRRVATVSANGDKMIGNLIADAYAKIGNDSTSMLQIEESGTIDTKIDIAEGFEIDRGYMSPAFINDVANMKVVHASPLFLICDYTLSTMNDIAPVINNMVENKMIQHPIIIIAHDFDGEAFSSMVLSNKKGAVKTCLVKAPNAYRTEALDDIATVTGGIVIRDSAGLKPENATIVHLGRAGGVVITENKMTIIGGESDPKEMEEQKNGVQVQLDEMKDDKLKEVWKKRLAMLCGKVGIIRVGGATDLEMKERKDRVDDACRAVRSAIEEGYVAGGGLALIKCLKEIVSDENIFIGDEMIGGKIVCHAILSPLSKMLNNAGLEDLIGTEIPFNMERHPILKEVIYNKDGFGYNVREQKYMDMIENGIIDPTKVIRCALQNAASVASAVITSDCLIVEVE